MLEVVLELSDRGTDWIVLVIDRSGPANWMSPTDVMSWAGSLAVAEVTSEEVARCAVPAASVRATDWWMRARVAGDPGAAEVPEILHAAKDATNTSATIEVRVRDRDARPQ